MCGVYAIPAADVELVGARTNKVPTGPYRGAGRPEAAYFLERAVDDAARALGMDPVELRRRNLVREFPHRTPLGWTYDSGDYERCLDLALELVRTERRCGDERRVAAPASRCTSSARAGMCGERGGDARAERPRRDPQRLVARTGRGTTRRSPRSPPTGSGSRSTTWCCDSATRRGAARRRHVREPLGGDGRLGDRARARPAAEERASRWPPGCSACEDGRAALGRRAGHAPDGRTPRPARRRRGGGRAARRARASSPTWCSPRAPTPRSSRSSAPPGACACCASPRSTTRGTIDQSAARPGTGARRHRAGARRVPGRGGVHDEAGPAAHSRRSPTTAC